MKHTRDVKILQMRLTMRSLNRIHTESCRAGIDVKGHILRQNRIGCARHSTYTRSRASARISISDSDTHGKQYDSYQMQCIMCICD